MAEYCKHHNGVTRIFCEHAGYCPLGGSSSDQKRGAFPFIGKGNIPKSPAKDVYKAPTEHQRRVAEGSENKNDAEKSIT